MAGDRPHASLLQGDTPEWRLWSLVAELANRIRPESWVLIGGQMVALHMHLAGATPRRTTADIDIVADILTERTAFQRCKTAARDIGLEAQPSITGRTLHEQPVDVSAEVDGNPHRVTFAQRVGVWEARIGGLRVTLRVTA